MFRSDFRTWIFYENAETAETFICFQHPIFTQIFFSLNHEEDKNFIEYFNDSVHRNENFYFYISVNIQLKITQLNSLFHALSALNKLCINLFNLFKWRNKTKVSPFQSLIEGN